MDKRNAILDSFIERLTKEGEENPAVLKKNELTWLCEQAKMMFLRQPMFLQLSAPIIIVGDIHGQFHDLLRVFQLAGPADTNNYLFLGDYVDRGNRSCAVASLLFAYKLRYPNNFFLLRGNHECPSVNKVYGFFDEARQNYSPTIWQKFNEAFFFLPVAALIESSILCIHGGLSPDITRIEQFHDLPRGMEIPRQGPLCDTTWSDPDPKVTGFVPSDRGSGYLFGKDVVDKFVEENNIDVIIRAHQAVDTGYFFPYDSKRLVTLFSAPNYCGDYGNRAAVLLVDESLRMQFLVMEQDDTCDSFIPLRPQEEVRPSTPPLSTMM